MKKLLVFIACILCVVLNAEDNPPGFNWDNHGEGTTYHKGVLCIKNIPRKSLDFTKKYPKMKTLVFFEGNVAAECKLEKFYSNQNSDLGLSNNSNLRSIEIFYTSINGVLKNSYLPQVTHLQIRPRYYNVPYFDLNVLHAMPNLKSLHWDVERVPEEEGDFEKIISFTPFLEHFSLGELWFSLTDRNIELLSQLHNLKSFSLGLFCASPSYEQKLQEKLEKALPGVKITINNRYDIDFVQGGGGYLDYENR